MHTFLLTIRNKLDKIKHALNNAPLELITTLIPQNDTQERKHTSLLARELQAKSPDSLNNRNLELIGNLSHKPRDLLHQTVDTSFIARLEQSGDGKSGNRPVGARNQSLDIHIAMLQSIRLEGRDVV